jgi:hypothetical protein
MKMNIYTHTEIQDKIFKNYHTKKLINIHHIEFFRHFGGIFIEGAPKNKKKLTKQKNKKKVMMLGGANCTRGPQTQMAPWENSHFLIGPVRPWSFLAI